MTNVAPMLGAILGVSKTPKGEDKKRAVKPRKNKTTAGEKSVVEASQQHGELASDREPTPLQQVHDHARRAKVNATRDWVDGRITTSQHSKIHARANHVLSGRETRSFKGTTGERSPGKMGQGHLW